MPRDIQGLSRAELEAWCTAAGEPRYRAPQILAWVHRKDAGSFDAMSSLSRVLRAKLAAEFTLDRLAPAFVATAADGTRKLLFHLPAEEGGRAASIESVLIPQFERADGARDRLTLCISSQAGCGMGCAFCATARMGLVRNLRPGEIVGQVRAGRAVAAPRAITNVVLMGMGEPLANYDAVRTALEILTAEWGQAISPRRITASTVGLAPMIPRLIAETRVNLAVSLSGTTDAQRARLMPVNRRWPLAELLEAARDYGRVSGRRVTLEYTLIADVNDRAEDADRLAAMARDLPSKINLIPYNPVPGLPYRRPAPEAVEAFALSLYPRAPSVTVRQTMGGEIWAACGQLGGLDAGA